MNKDVGEISAIAITFHKIILNPPPQEPQPLSSLRPVSIIWSRREAIGLMLKLTAKLHTPTWLSSKAMTTWSNFRAKQIVRHSVPVLGLECTVTLGAGTGPLEMNQWEMCNTGKLASLTTGVEIKTVPRSLPGVGRTWTVLNSAPLCALMVKSTYISLSHCISRECCLVRKILNCGFSAC